MRRFLRITLNAATAVSLALCVATVMLWVRSTRICDRWSTHDGHTRWLVDLDAGWILVDHRWISRSTNAPRWPWRHEVKPTGSSPRVRPAWLFDVMTDERSEHGVHLRQRSWWVAYRTVLLITLVVPTLRLARLLFVREPARRGLCPACGYDLRATPERCPECGTVLTR